MSRPRASVSLRRRCGTCAHVSESRGGGLTKGANRSASGGAGATRGASGSVNGGMSVTEGAGASALVTCRH